MTGTRESLSAMIGDLAGMAAVRRRILQTLFPLLLTMPQRANFKQILNLNPTGIKNNPKIKELLLSTSYVPLAA